MRPLAKSFLPVCTLSMFFCLPFQVRHPAVCSTFIETIERGSNSPRKICDRGGRRRRRRRRRDRQSLFKNFGFECFFGQMRFLRSVVYGVARGGGILAALERRKKREKDKERERERERATALLSLKEECCAEQCSEGGPPPSFSTEGREEGRLLFAKTEIRRQLDGAPSVRAKVASWQNLIPSFPWIAPRKGREQILQHRIAET